ncbi:MAG: pseudouridine synthase [Kiritimatiellia bacterium]
MQETTTIRLQKYLAQAGVASRRKAEEMIQHGRIAVNGRRTTIPGTTVNPQTDHVTVDGKEIKPQSNRITYMLNKPAGLICSASNSQGETIFSLFKQPKKQRLFSVGRLDKFSEGLLLVTNDGDLAQTLTHPRYGHTKTYDVTINGDISREILQAIRKPMLLEGYRTKPAKVWIHQTATTPHTTTLRIILAEGRSRQIRNMCAQLNLPIRRLRRIRIGLLDLGDLKTGSYRPLSANDFTLIEQTDREIPQSPMPPASARTDVNAQKSPARPRSSARGAARNAPQSRAPRLRDRAAPATRPDANGPARSRRRSQSTD